MLTGSSQVLVEARGLLPPCGAVQHIDRPGEYIFFEVEASSNLVDLEDPSNLVSIYIVHDLYNSEDSAFECVHLENGEAVSGCAMAVTGEIVHGFSDGVLSG